MKKLGLVLASAVVLAGCASEVMKGFVGKDITAAVAQYGPPVNVFRAGNKVAFQWELNRSSYVPGTTTTNIYGSTAYTTTTGGYVASQQCFYTLYGVPNAQKSHTIVGFESPRLGCE